MPEQRRQFSAQFKAEAVQMVIETGKPIASVARDLGIHEAQGQVRGAPGGDASGEDLAEDAVVLGSGEFGEFEQAGSGDDGAGEQPGQALSGLLMRRSRIAVTGPTTMRTQSRRKKTTGATAVATWTATRKVRYGDLSAVRLRSADPRPPPRH